MNLTNEAPDGKLYDRTTRPHIALLGKMGSGKTTAAKYLAENYPHYRTMHFAAALKATARMIWGGAVDNNRDLMQKFGVMVREIDEDAWVNVVRRDIENLSDLTIPDINKGEWRAIVDDCRFPNEYDMLASYKATFIRITAAEDIRFGRLQRIHKIDNREQMNHISETALDDDEADYTIINNHDGPDSLFDALDRIMDREERKV